MNPPRTRRATTPDYRLFGQFRFDMHSLELWRSDRPVALAPKPSRILALLLARPGALVTREELCEAGWQESVASPELALNTAVRQIRLALEDSAEAPRFIQTVPRRGYRIIAPVKKRPSDSRVLPLLMRSFATTRWRYRLTALSTFCAGLFVLLSVTRPGAPPTVSIARTSSLHDTIDAGTGRMIEESIRTAVARNVRELRVLATAEVPGHDPNPAYVVRSFLRIAERGRLRLDVQIVRSADRVILWAGWFDPHCPRVEDPVSAIADYVASVLAARI